MRSKGCFSICFRFSQFVASLGAICENILDNFDILRYILPYLKVLNKNTQM